uniref:Uncharacterized protein n=1 Tax=Glossina palpalis gambiensis TaxID=67801 RepID=A0A1B0BN99_9MUSC
MPLETFQCDLKTCSSSSNEDDAVSSVFDGCNVAMAMLPDLKATLQTAALHDTSIRTATRIRKPNKRVESLLKQYERNTI